MNTRPGNRKLNSPTSVQRLDRIRVRSHELLAPWRNHSQCQKTKLSPSLMPRELFAFVTTRVLYGEVVSGKNGKSGDDSERLSPLTFWQNKHFTTGASHHRIKGCPLQILPNEEDRGVAHH